MKNLSSRPIEYSKARRGQARGFTLVELLVVVAIAAILSALLLGGFFQITASNRRSGCQVNMSQIYNALRLYANDYDGKYPYYNNTNTGTIPPGTNNGGVGGLPVDTLGLWKLYTTQSPSDIVNVGSDDPNFRLYSTTTNVATSPRKMVGLYLRNIDNLHCPNDAENENLNIAGSPTLLNPKYLSYQTVDGSTASNTPTYQTQRTSDINDPKWSRQLMSYNGANLVSEKRPASDTVILWCKWHRTGLGSDPKRGDIVLFADGSVKTRPLTADAGWLRTP